MVKVLYGTGTGYGIEDHLREKREADLKAAAEKKAGVNVPKKE